MKMIDDEVIAAVTRTLEAGRLFRYDCDAPDDSPTAVLERRFAEVAGARYALAMNSCSSAMFTALLCAGVRPGDRVAIPAFTFIAVPSAVIHAGAVPVLIEVDDDYVMDMADFEEKVRTHGIGTLLLSYMRGRAPDIDRVLQACDRLDVTLVEDAAHSLGVLWKGRQTGTFGLAGAFSAQSNKIVDSGEGGILVTDDEQVAFEAMLYAGCYESNWRKHFGTDAHAARLQRMVNAYPAFNFRMSNLSAAALLPQMDKVEDRAARLNANYARLVSVLSKSNRIRLPRFSEGARPAADSLQCEILDAGPAQLVEIQSDLRRQGIKTEIFSGDNARSFWNWGFVAQDVALCPKTRDLLSRTLDMRLPLCLETADIDRIGHAILATVESHA